MSSSIQQRKAEILAKKAKLAELKRQRELRQREFSQVRANSGDASEVRGPYAHLRNFSSTRAGRLSSIIYLGRIASPESCRQQS